MASLDSCLRGISASMHKIAQQFVLIHTVLARPLRAGKACPNSFQTNLSQGILRRSGIQIVFPIELKYLVETKGKRGLVNLVRNAD